MYPWAPTGRHLRFLCAPREILFTMLIIRHTVYNGSRPLSAYEIPARNDIAQLHDAPGPRGMLVPLKRLGIIFLTALAGGRERLRKEFDGHVFTEGGHHGRDRNQPCDDAHCARDRREERGR